MTYPAIEFSQFKHKHDVEPVHQRLLVPDFVAGLGAPEVRANKDGRAIAFATFNGPRQDKNTTAVTGWALDFDNGKLGLDEIVTRLNGHAFAVHTTYSHTPASPKYRAIIFFAEPVEPGRAGEIFAHFQGKFGDALDPSCKNPSRLYYTPACPPGGEPHFRFLFREGEPFNANALKPTASAAPAVKGFHLPDEIPAGQRNAVLFSAMCSLIAKGWSDDAVLAAAREENQRRVFPPLPEAELRALLKSARKHRDPAQDAVLAELNARHFAVTVNGHFYVVAEEFDVVNGRHALSYSKSNDFELRYANRPKINSKTIARHWLESPERREYAGIVFSPGADPPPQYYNLWRGFAVVPANGDCSLYLRHILDNVCRGDHAVFGYVIGWMADAVQNPTRRPGTALVLRGKQGTGKGTMMKWFGALFGQHYLHVNSAAQILGQFNAILRDALVVFADEAFWAGDKSHEGAFKRLITEDTLVIEAKFQPAAVTPNYVRLVVASNHEWVVPAGLEERRVVVLDVSEARMQDHAYFAAIEQQMTAGGLAALLKHLQGLDVGAVDLRTLPVTAALIDQKLHSLEDVLAWWASRLWEPTYWLRNESNPEGFVTNEQLYTNYECWTEGHARRRKLTPIQFGMQIAKVLPQLKKDHRGAGRGRLVPPLAEARADFERMLGGRVSWPDA